MLSRHTNLRYEDDGLGGTPPSPAEEQRRAREFHAQQTRIGEQFVGGSLLPEEQAPSNEGSEEQATTIEYSQEQYPEQATEEDTEQQRARMLQSQRAAAEKDSTPTVQTTQDALENAQAAVRIAEEGIQLATAPTGIPFLTLLGQMNLGLLYTQFFKGSLPPPVEGLIKQTKAEQVATIGLDCGTCGCCVCAPALFIGLLITVVFEFVPGLKLILKVIDFFQSIF